MSAPQLDRVLSNDDKKSTKSLDATVLAAEELESYEPPVRPPIDYSSVGSFFSSLWRRFASLWTRRFVWSLLAGQVVSLCITCTNVTTTELVSRNWSLPTTQTFFLYVRLVISSAYTQADAPWQLFLAFCSVHAVHDLSV